MELSLKTSIDSSKDDLDSNLDRRRVLVMKNGPEQKNMDTITNKLKNIQKRGKTLNKKARAKQEKENSKEVVEAGAISLKGKSGRSIKILDEQINEN